MTLGRTLMPASGPTISLEHKGGASISPWWLIPAVCGAFGLAWLGSGFDTSVGEANGGGRAFEGNGRLPLPLMQRLRDFEMNVRKSTGLEGVDKEERPRFGARLSINLAQGGRGGSRSMGPVGRPTTWRLFLCFSIYIPGTATHRLAA